MLHNHSSAAVDVMTSQAFSRLSLEERGMTSNNEVTPPTDLMDADGFVDHDKLMSRLDVIDTVGKWV